MGELANCPAVVRDRCVARLRLIELEEEYAAEAREDIDGNAQVGVKRRRLSRAGPEGSRAFVDNSPDARQNDIGEHVQEIDARARADEANAQAAEVDADGDPAV